MVRTLAAVVERRRRLGSSWGGPALSPFAACAASAAGAHALTDVTGFGLLGHLHALARASDVPVDEQRSRLAPSTRLRRDDRRRGTRRRASRRLHSGECESLDEDIAGIAVHIGARASALAGAGEVFVSRTVKDLVVGSGLEFEPRGTHELKGVPGDWELFALADARSPTVPVAAEQPPVRSSDRIVLAAARRAPGLLRLAGRFAPR